MSRMQRLIASIAGTVLIVAALFTAYVWMFCRVYIEPNQFAVVIKKTGAPLEPGQKIAEPGQKGIQRETLGPGRHFYNPWTTEIETRTNAGPHQLIEISAGDPKTWDFVWPEGNPDTGLLKLKGDWPQVGIVTSLVGKPAPGGENESEVVDEGYQGIRREVLTPGTYRLNPYAYKVEMEPAVIVPVGYAGVVTSQLGEMPGVEYVTETIIGPDGEPIEGNRKQVQKLAKPGQRGVLSDILPPGIHYLNPYVYKVELVQIGYNQISQLKSQVERDNISFPSADGFTVTVEVTVVWGRHPQHTPKMINRLGDVERIRRIILGQIRSICRNLGSDYNSIDFIRGEKREQYQIDVTETLKRVAAEKDIEILIALVQNIEVQGASHTDTADANLKQTIQAGFIAKEEDLTNQKQRETAVVEAELETAVVAIDIAREQIQADTRKQVAEIEAEGRKQAELIDAERDLDVAKIDRQIAELEAEKTLVLGRAEAEVEEMRNRAEAEGKSQMVAAFGSGRAYNLYTFAQTFQPEHIDLIFANEGTFWTDLSRVPEVAGAELLRQNRQQRISQGGSSE